MVVLLVNIPQFPVTQALRQSEGACIQEKSPATQVC